MRFIGLDIGTSTISAVVWNAETGEQERTIAVPNASYVKNDESWIREQDPNVIMNICNDILRQLKADNRGFDGIGITGQMHGVLYIDGDGHAVSPLVTWEDGRGNLRYRDGNTYCGLLNEITGYRLASGFGLVTHFYNTVNKLVPAEAYKICTITDYVAMRLCGRKSPLMHSSNAASLGLYDVNAGSFDKNAVTKAGVDASYLPDVANSEIIIGTTDDNIPIAIPIGDNQASFLGSTDKSCKILVNIGTGSQISVFSPKYIAVDGLECRPYIDGHYLIVGSALCGGSAYRLLMKFFEEIARGVTQRDVTELAGNKYDFVEDDIYDFMEREATKVYSRIRTSNEFSDELIIDTRFRGTRESAETRGSIRNIGVDNFTTGHFALGILKGICAELFDFYNKLPAGLDTGDRLAASGNAVRRNALLQRIISDMFKKAVIIPPYKEEAAQGAAILSARLAGACGGTVDIGAAV